MRKLLDRARERGAAAVEFALVLPVLVMIMMGIIDFGMVTNAQAIVANAARDGARAASMGANASTACTAAVKAATTLLGYSNTGNCSTSVPSVTVTCLDVTGAGCSSSFDTSREVGGTAVVSVTYTYKWVSPAIFGLPGQTTITKQAFMRIETLS
jgi:Flp pilus assembly protein TadG